MTHLCPVLGKPYTEKFKKRCPTELKKANGKTLPISFIGIMPYIKYNPFGGSEPLIIRMLAKKHEFIPNFVAEQAYDRTKLDNGTTYGMVHRVRFINHRKKQNIMFGLTHRYQQNIQKLGLDKQASQLTDTK